MTVVKEEGLCQEGADTLLFAINHIPHKGLMAAEHWHDYYEILYIVDGDCLQVIDRREQSVRTGDVVIIEPGDLHGTQAVSETGATVFVLQFFPAALNFNNTSADRSQYLDAFLDEGRLCSGYLCKPYACEREIARVASQISEEYTLCRQGYRLIVKGLVYEFLGYLNRNGETVQFQTADDARLQTIREVCRYVEERYTAPPSLAETARAFGYSTAHLSRLFKRITGKNWKAYVDYVRIQEAKRLLRYEKRTVTETADRLGYGSVASFHRAFKRVTGGNPSQIGDIYMQKREWV